MNDSTILSGHVAAYYPYSGQVQMLGLGVIRGQVRGADAIQRIADG